MIETDFSDIVDLKIGKNEKLIYLTDKNHGVLAEYRIQEIGCPPSANVVSCNQFFMDTEVKCQESTSMFFDLKDATCKCRSGYFMDQATKTCEKCRCPYIYQICTLHAKDCGEKPDWRINFQDDEAVKDACIIKAPFFYYGEGSYDLENSTYLFTSHRDQMAVYQVDFSANKVTLIERLKTPISGQESKLVCTFSDAIRQQMQVSMISQKTDEVLGVSSAYVDTYTSFFQHGGVPTFDLVEPLYSISV